MTLLPFSLVLVSIFTHAYWNFLIKSSTNKHVFIGLSKLAEVVLFIIPAIYFLTDQAFNSQILGFILVAALLTFFNYALLANAYKYGDLSLVYPLSRSSLIFLPFLAWYFIGEKIDTTGYLAIFLIILGTFAMHMESLDKNGIRTLFKNLSNKGTKYALLSALTVACYTLWDKVAITKMEPFLYFYLYTFIFTIFYNLFSLKKYDNIEFAKEWKLNKSKIIQVGFFNTFTYILVLTALSMTKATYVSGLRQLSIIVGILLGHRLLKETFGLPKIIGIALTLIGGFLIYWAR